MSLTHYFTFRDELPPGWINVGGDKFDPANVYFDGESMILTTGAKGSLVQMTQPDAQLYGRWDVCLSLAAGVDCRGVALLWPSDGVWAHGELDFFEIGSGDPTRLVNTQTAHYTSANKQVHTRYAIDGDFTLPHVVSIDWRAGAIRYSCDGVELATVTNPAALAALHTPMKLHLQTAVSKKPKPKPSGGDMRVWWARVYS